MKHTPHLADPRRLWLDLARMYNNKALHEANQDNHTKAADYEARAAEARTKAATYLPC